MKCDICGISMYAMTHHYMDINDNNLYCENCYKKKLVGSGKTLMVVNIPEIEIECKNCKRTFLFGTSNADNNCTFCNSECEEDYSFIDCSNTEDDIVGNHDPVDPSIYHLKNNKIWISNCFQNGEIVEYGFAHLKEKEAMRFIDRQNEKLKDSHEEYLKNKYGKKTIPKWESNPLREWFLHEYQVLWC